MVDRAGEVFIIESGQLRTLSAVDLRDSPALRQVVADRTLEDALQTLLAQYPQLVPGSQIGPDADAPRFILLRREMSVPSGSIDLVMVDQRGVPTLVETKLVENPEARRAVIGQILEYASYATETWTNGRLRAAAEEFWAQRGASLDEQLRTLGVQDLDAFWDLVEANLLDRKLRLIVVADMLRPEARRILEYLNQELSRAAIYGLELRCFAESADRLVVVPHLVGQSQAIQDVKEVRARDVRWTLERLRSEYARIAQEEPVLGQRLSSVLEWAVAKGLFLETYALESRPAFRLQNPDGEMTVSFYRDGAIHCQVGRMAERLFSGGAAQRDAYARDLKQLGLLDPPFDPNSLVAGKNLVHKLAELADGELSSLLAVFERYFVVPGPRS